MPRLRLFLFLLLFSCTVFHLQAQQNSPDANSTLTANTELVLVPVQVKGPDGKPLPGLKREDFVLHSDGKAQPISIFEETLRAESGPHPVSAAAQPLSSNTISNVPSTGMPDNILILALDLVNTEFLDQTRAKNELLKYLGQQLPSQHFALVAITKNGLFQIHNFSSDPAVLVEALQRVQGATGKELTDPPPLDSILSASQFATPCNPINEYDSMMAAFRDSQIYGAYAQKIAAHATLNALKELAQAYAGVPGRKSVIWLTGGMPMLLYDAFSGGVKGGSMLNGDPELLDDYDRTFQTLNNANIAIYGVDVKGIKLNRTYLATGVDQRMHNPVYQTYAGSRVVSPLGYHDDAIKVLSSVTGGKSCTANTDLKDCIDEAVADSISYYMLGFYVPQTNRKAGWHKLDVKLTKDRGSVRSRSSYYLASRTLPSDKEVNRTLREAAQAKIDYTGIAFSVERQAAGSTAATMRIKVPATSLLLAPGHQLLSYDIATVPLNGKGDLATDIRVIHLNLNEQQTETALSKGWAFFDPVQGTPTQAIKYVLRDNGTGHIGSLVFFPPKTGAGS